VDLINGVDVLERTKKYLDPNGIRISHIGTPKNPFPGVKRWGRNFSNLISI